MRIGCNFPNAGVAEAKRTVPLAFKERFLVLCLFGQYRKHDTQWSGSSSSRYGSSSLQRSCACGHLPANLHPGGGLIGLGTSPGKLMRVLDFSMFGSGIGLADISALVYG